MPEDKTFITAKNLLDEVDVYGIEGETGTLNREQLDYLFSAAYEELHRLVIRVKHFSRRGDPSGAL